MTLTARLSGVPATLSINWGHHQHQRTYGCGTPITAKLLDEFADLLSRRRQLETLPVRCTL